MKNILRSIRGYLRPLIKPAIRKAAIKILRSESLHEMILDFVKSTKNPYDNLGAKALIEALKTLADNLEGKE